MGFWKRLPVWMRKGTADIVDDDKTEKDIQYRYVTSYDLNNHLQMVVWEKSSPVHVMVTVTKGRVA